MPYYLTQWKGTGTETDPFVPNLTAARWEAIDLRPDPTVVSGYAVVWTEALATSVPASATFLGDGSFAQIPNNIKNRLRSNLGLASLVGLTVVEIVRELLTVHAGQPGRWNKLLPERRNTAFGQIDHYEIRLGGRLSEWEEAVP